MKKKLSQEGFGAVEGIIIVIILAVIVIAGVIIYKHDRKKVIPVAKVSASTVINQFNKAMGTANKTKVLSLESGAMQSGLESGSTAEHKTLPEYPISNNYYVICSQVLGSICTYDFSTTNLSKATIKTGSYKSPSGVIGVQETFTAVTTISAPGESGSSSTSFYVDAIPNDNSWLINNVGGFSANL